MLDDLETSTYEKITLLRDAAQANGMFTDTINVRDQSHPMRRLVLIERNTFDPEKESAREYVTRMLTEKDD